MLIYLYIKNTKLRN